MNDQTKHTPGPWSVRFDFVVQAASFDDGRLVPVAQPYGVNADRTDLFANARLIAAAPDLVEALQRALMALTGYLPGHRNEVTDAAIEHAHAALAKATGSAA